MQFKKYSPSPALQSIIPYFWTVAGTKEEYGLRYRFVPDGYVEWIFHLETPWRFRFSQSTQNYTAQHHVMGHFKNYLDFQLPDQPFRMLAVKFYPWAAQAIWQIDMSKSTEAYMELESLEDNGLKELTDRIHGQKDIEACISCIENYLLQKLKDFKSNDLEKLVGQILQSKKEANFADYPLSRRRLEQRFKSEIGLSPATFQRTIRINRVINTMMDQPDSRLTTLAYQFGFADQAHMNREFINFTGSSPRAFLKRTNPDGDIFNFCLE